jgi:hypothetical protein
MSRLGLRVSFYAMGQSRYVPPLAVIFMYLVCVNSPGHAQQTPPSNWWVRFPLPAT